MAGRGGWFVRFAHWSSGISGRPATFVLAVVAIVVWAVLGPVFHYSDTWQLVINTATTIITFLMVFVIQNTQNRDTAGLHIKLDELILVSEKARNKLLNLDHLDDAELEKMKADYGELAKRVTERQKGRRSRKNKARKS